jgi:RNA polymerase sigma factor (TIGR02999 family)
MSKRTGSDPEPNEVTRLIERASGGDPRAAGELLPLVYEQLRARARKEMAGERPDHTLQATALVHEAYMRLVGTRQITWDNRAHFYVAAAEAMRRILIEHARKRGRVKRGGDHRRVSLSMVELTEHGNVEEILSLDEAFRRLEERDKRLADVVRLRFYAGLSEAEVGAALGVTERTVRRQWALARAWLRRELGASNQEQR